MVVKYDSEVKRALSKLGKDFPNLSWIYTPVKHNGQEELVLQWLGEEHEDVMLCVFKDKFIEEEFHRHNFFYLHFIYQGTFQTICDNKNNSVTINEGDCYIGQPYKGYAARRDSDTEGVIIAVCIRPESFFQEFLPSFASEADMLKFFLKPSKEAYSSESVHIPIPKSSPIWRLLGLMAIEYAFKNEDTQKTLKPLVMSLCMHTSSEYRRQNLPGHLSLTEKIVEYIDVNSVTASLSSVAVHFGYHPVYVSRLLSKEVGKTFSQILSESRLKKAKLLLRETDLPIEKVADMLGYNSSSALYKAYKKHYGTTPRELVHK